MRSVTTEIIIPTVSVLIEVEICAVWGIRICLNLNIAIMIINEKGTIKGYLADIPKIRSEKIGRCIVLYFC